MVHLGRPWLGNNKLMRNDRWCKPTNSVEFVLWGLLQPYAWNLPCLTHCQAVSRGKREESRIRNLDKTRYGHTIITRYFPPSVTTLTSPQAVSLVQESWGLSQGQPQQRTLAHSLPQHRGVGGEEEGGETSLARSKVEIWWSSGLRLASGRLVGRSGWYELNRLAQVGALTPLTCYLVRTLLFRLQYNPPTRFRETLLLAKKRQK